MSRLARRASLFFLACVYGCGTPPPFSPTAPTPLASAPAVAPLPNQDPAPTTEGAVTVAYVRGMEVLVKRAPGAEFVAAQLIIRGGARNWSDANAGIEDLALGIATTGGTRSLGKVAYSEALSSLGATIRGDGGADFSTIRAKAPADAWDAIFPLLVETFLSPALPRDEFDLARQGAIATRRRELADGEGRLLLLKRRLLFEGHPYQNRVSGTPGSLAAIRYEDIAPYLAKLRNTNRLVFIVVGDVDPAHVRGQIQAAFASVDRAPYAEAPIGALHFNAPHLATDAWRLPTNYIASVFAGPLRSDPDFVPLRLAVGRLHERVFEELRLKRDLSYMPQASFITYLGASFGELAVTTTEPDQAMKIMFQEVERIKSDLVTPKELDALKTSIVTSSALEHETVDGEATALAYAVLLGGDWRSEEADLARVRAVTPEQAQSAARRWLVNLQTAIVGDPTKLSPSVLGVR